MELTQLRQFKVIAEQENISKAAEILFISQPALSQMLNKLEEELGTKLFDRKKNKILLNENGKKALEHVISILEEIKLLEKEFLTKKILDTPLSIASTSPSAIWFFTSRIRKQIPDFFLHTSVVQQKDIEKKLIERSIDMAISFELFNDTQIYNIPFSEIRYFITVDKLHPLAKYDILSLKDLNGCELLGMENGSLYLSSFSQKFISDYNINLIITRVTDTYIFYDTLKTNQKYITFSNSLEINYSNDIYGNRKIIKIKEKLPRLPLYLSYLKENQSRIQPIKNVIIDNYKEMMI